MAAPFRLARVLRLREQMRRLRGHEAEAIAARLGTARRDVARIAAERERCAEEEARAARAGVLTPETLQVGRAYDAALAAAEVAETQEAARLARALEAKRAELLRARQEEEKYVRLAAAHRQRVLEEEAREVDRVLDEVAVDRHRRRRKEQGHEAV
ncbi:MAG: hypothetical protein IT294_17965 [Deltaproteobacteria bacterium]|nr:hypothetical protein [Deltaproteobacteria bacterium]